MSLSAGVNADNFADAVACGFAPVTTCTDLLRPTGYRRLPRYLKALEARMAEHGAETVAAYVAARAIERGDVAQGTRATALGNLEAYASDVGADPRYAAAPAAAAPERPPLALVDCESCNQCTLACPNGAIFDVATPPGGAGRCERQWVLLADFCNACGNCDTFCPQAGGPYRVKARFHTSRTAWEQDGGGSAVLVEDAGRRVETRPDVTAETAGWLRALAESALAGVNPLAASAGGR
jgi:putative selenate reductase